MKTKGMGIVLLSAAALLGTTAARAELPWTYGEVGYSKADGVDNFETDAYDLKASVGFLDIWHASLGYTDGTSEQGSDQDVDFDGFRLIVGAHPQLTPNTQLITDLTYFNYDTDGGEGDFDTGSVDGYGVGFGLRHALSDKFELGAEVWYTEGSYDPDCCSDEDYNDTTLELTGRYNWMPQLSTGLTVTLNNGPAGGYYTQYGEDAIRFDVRWSFLGGLASK